MRACSSGVSFGSRRSGSSAGSPIGSEPSGSRRSGEVALHAVRLDERHRRGDAADQLGVVGRRLRRPRAPELTGGGRGESGRSRGAGGATAAAAPAEPFPPFPPFCTRGGAQSRAGRGPRPIPRSRTAHATRAGRPRGCRDTRRGADVRNRRSRRRRHAFRLSLYQATRRSPRAQYSGFEYQTQIEAPTTNATVMPRVV